MKKFILLIALFTQTFSAYASSDADTKLELFCHVRTSAGMVFLEVYSKGQQQTVELSLLGESLLAPQALVRTPDHGKLKLYASYSVTLTVIKATAQKAPMGNTQVRGILSVDTPELILAHEEVTCEMKP